MTKDKWFQVTIKQQFSPSLVAPAITVGFCADAPAGPIHALRMAFGDTSQSVHVEVIFTSPINKVYGSEISQRLTGVTAITVPSDAEVIGSKAKQFTIVVHRSIPHLEGHYAFSQLNLKQDSWIVDCGNRTLIETLVSPAGRILNRQYFGGAGVLGLAQKITQSESLAAPIAEPTAQRVIDTLFSSGAGKFADDIAADTSATIAEPLAFMTEDCSRFLIGGGATVPGLAFARPIAQHGVCLTLIAVLDAIGYMISDEHSGELDPRMFDVLKRADIASTNSDLAKGAGFYAVIAASAAIAAGGVNQVEG
ncbi:MAG: hypothetical protein AAF810_24020 [Cyanobacteria bacterium P01_D01_bin.36]